ncbi:hypothetical protein C1O66_04355 [Paucibacter aquatile]|uniref:DUF560 domain-containing protein n=2 Tax=Kinneretia aquatilis TaxID=2070761 RepID=A0A2N8KTR6_9BURK|nr:hypothetical protein C1O66_04355 [Paucibacter aquatile]
MAFTASVLPHAAQTASPAHRRAGRAPALAHRLAWRLICGLGMGPFLSLPPAHAAGTSAASPVPQEAADSVGLHGHISLLLMAEQRRSRLDGEGQAQQESLQSTVDAHRQLRLRPMFELRQRLGSTAGEWRVSSAVGGVADGYHMLLGSRMRWDDGSTLGLYWMPALPQREVWQDPYALGVVRQRSRESLQGWQIEASQLLGSSYNLRLSSAQRRIATELSGQQSLAEAERLLLRRSGRVSELSLWRSHDVGAHQTLSWQLDARHDTAEGQAMAHRRWGGELRYQQQWGRQGLALSLAWHRQKQRGPHPLAPASSGVASEQIHSAALMAFHAAPFGLRKFTAFGRLSWRHRQSSWDFHDARDLSAAIGLRRDF